MRCGRPVPLAGLVASAAALLLPLAAGAAEVLAPPDWTGQGDDEVDHPAQACRRRRSSRADAQANADGMPQKGGGINSAPGADLLLSEGSPGHPPTCSETSV